MEELSGNSKKHLSFFLKKINEGDPLSVIRLGDGEYMILRGQHLETQDRWAYRGGTLTGDLHDSIKNMVALENSFIGIACRDCLDARNLKQWYVDTFGIKNNQLTYANIFCNANWREFTDYFINSKKEFYYIGPGRNKTDKLNIKDSYITDEKQVDRWDAEKDTFLKDIDRWCDEKISSGGTKLFIFSVGPVAKILVSRLAQNHPTHQFIDCGSAFDIFLKGWTNRLYTSADHGYSRQICDLEKGHSYDPIK